MKQIWPTYAYSPATNVLTLTGLNIDRDQLLLVTAADRGRIMYNFADSSVTASAFTSGANTALTLVATTAGLTTTAALVIYYDDQLASTTVTVSSLPAISGTVTANTFAIQGTAVTTSNFTSTTASTVLASFNATREVLTIFNEGAGNLHICAGATCTTIAYQVRLSAGDYYEVPNHQTTITHSAVFATAGTARVTEVS